MINVQEKVIEYFVNGDHNCAITTLLILSEEFSIPLHEQVIEAATGLNGAGRFQAQCGLVEGSLMFLGIWGESLDLSRDEIVNVCYYFADAFTEEFGSLSCLELRPEGFKPENPPHLCEPLAQRTVKFAINYINNIKSYKFK